MITLLGDIVMRSMATGHTGEGELVVGRLKLWSLALASGLPHESFLGIDLGLCFLRWPAWRWRARDRVRGANGERLCVGDGRKSLREGLERSDCLSARAQLAQGREKEWT